MARRLLRGRAGAGAFFSPAALLAAAYVLFLGLVFHGPAHWAGSPMEVGLFVNHLTFIGGLLFAAVHGPGDTLAIRTKSAVALAGRDSPAR